MSLFHSTVKLPQMVPFLIAGHIIMKFSTLILNQYFSPFSKYDRKLWANLTLLSSYKQQTFPGFHHYYTKLPVPSVIILKYLNLVSRPFPAFSTFIEKLVVTWGRGYKY